jgi:hypothetical protein
MKKRKLVTGDQLKASLSDPDWILCFDTFEAYQRQGPRIEDLQTLIDALTYPEHDGVIEMAAECIGKLGPSAITALPALLQAADRFNPVFELAPAYPAAILAAVALDPLAEEIPIVIRRNFATDNSLFKKASVRALLAIPTNECRLLLRQVVAYWSLDSTKPEKKLFDDAIARSLKT